MTKRFIILRGVAVHNLKDVNLDIPHRKLVVLCGLSGSGKTSLALDTLYAEGQRRYIDSFSAYARQFLQRLEKPEADRIDGIPPAIAVTHKNASRSNRATVGTATEVADYLRLLYARIGQVVCGQCGREVRQDTPQSAADAVQKLPEGTRYLIAFSQRPPQGQEYQGFWNSLREDGYLRVIIDGSIWNLTDALPARVVSEAVDVIVDRLTVSATSKVRLRDSLESAFLAGDGRARVYAETPVDATSLTVEIDGCAWHRRALSASLRCEECGIEYPQPEPRLFSFNSPLGACPACKGLGNVVGIDEGPDVSNPNLPGHWRSDRVCSACHGMRLRPEALATLVGGKNIGELSRMRIRDVIACLRSLSLPEFARSIARIMLEQIAARLGYLEMVGLGYLTLDRTLRTLSGGEAARVALTSALGSSLVNMLYVLDEPSVGLHPADVDRLVNSLQALRNRGNTVIVVEHEEAILRAADQLIEIGPAAGERGGQVVFQGSLAEMLSSEHSLTGDYLAGRRGIGASNHRRVPNHGWIRLVGARGNNLKNVTVEFPLGVLCLVTGVSGAGKSTLIDDTLHPALCKRMNKASPQAAGYDDVYGDGQIEDVIMVDQSPIGRSPRSNPVTYIKAFDGIRELFAETVEARTRNLDATYFSFNVEKGRCTVCEGSGFQQIDMQFLADVFMKCPQCAGKRYRPDVLEIKYRGRNIAEVLDLTVREAFIFFRGRPKLQARLKRLIDVGLDYLRLGQPANTLSGGESQRLKLALHMAQSRKGRTLFLLDEPTTGLHFQDVVQLLDCFDALLAVGHSLIIVEHNLQLMKAADYLIDLGPGAGDEGGEVVAEGTPEVVAAVRESVTGRFLAEALSRSREVPSGPRAQS